jgi:ubiquinone/menaquinone biosynthesis C-methylase UbiE
MMSDMNFEKQPRYSPEDLRRAQEAAQFGPVGGRELEQYSDDLGLSLDDFQGKRVLDLGAGLNLKFATQLEAAGLSASVISYSPFLAKDDLRRDALAIAPQNVTAKSVAGMAEELPFADGSFDKVVSIHMLSYVAPESRIAVMSEICRVLAPGGVAYVGPTFKFRSQVPKIMHALRRRQDVRCEETPWHNNPLDKRVIKITKL